MFLKTQSINDVNIFRDVYTKRFPELESLVVQPLEYLMTAKELGNELENVKNNETLQQYLSQVPTFISSGCALCIGPEFQ